MMGRVFLRNKHPLMKILDETLSSVTEKHAVLGLYRVTDLTADENSIYLHLKSLLLLSQYVKGLYPSAL